jgi:hypothetical protein
MNIGSGLTDGRSRYPVPDSEVCRDAEGPRAAVLACGSDE